MGQLRRNLNRFGISVHLHRDPNEPSGIDLFHDALCLAGRQQPLIFDVGANVGETIRDLLAQCPTAKVIGFEPSPKTSEKLSAAFASNRQVRVERRALGDVPGTLPFAVTRAHSVNDSLLTMADEPDAPRIDVQVDTIDGFCQREGLQRIDYMKVDTQGYDLRVLMGAKHMLETRAIKAVSVEAMFQAMYVGQPTLTDLLRFAADVGYQPFGFYNNSYAERTLSFVDVMLVPAAQPQ